MLQTRSEVVVEGEIVRRSGLKSKDRRLGFSTDGGAVFA